MIFRFKLKKGVIMNSTKNILGGEKMTINKNWNCPSIFSCDNLNRHKELFEKVKKEGMKSVALIDEGTMQHLFLTSEMAKEYDLKIFIGCKIPFKLGSHVVKLALYPRNNKGLKQLSYMSTEFQKNEKKELSLAGKREALALMNIVVDATEARVDERVVKEVVRTLSAITSKGYLHVGLAETFSQKNKKRNLQIKEVLKKEGVGYIPFNKLLFLEEKDYEDFFDLVRIKEMSKPEDIENIFMNNEEIDEIFDYMDGVEDNSEKIFINTNLDLVIEKKEMKTPKYPIEEKFEVSPLFKTRFEEFIKNSTKEEVKSSAYLFHLVMKGLIERYGKNKEAIERALYELKVIIEKKFSDYFLIVWDIIRFAKNNGIAIGPGRGSAVGSIIAYSLNITEIDPLKWNLQFERFLNEFRLDFPDIDTDMSQRDREKVIAYTKNKYGVDYVSLIVTRSNYGFKNIVNNMLKIMRVPNDKVEKMRELKPENYASYGEFVSYLEKENKDAYAFVQSSKDIRILLQRGYALKDIPQGTSRHASGVLISSVPLKDEMPMMYDESGMLTQIPNDNDTNSLEQMGYLKFDFLGLRYLDVLEDAKRPTEIREGKAFPQIPINDPKALKMLSEGYTEGVFQFESASQYAKQIKIDDFKDIVALNALNRPGPMDNIPLFAERKGQPIKVFGKNKKELQGVECLYPILEETNGIIVYQEQINEIVCEWAGYSLGEAELFRKAVSKKQGKVLKEQRVIFIKRSLEKGRDKQTTIEIYDLILEFANYGFNKSHAVAYSWISYTCAYLKAHHTADYMAALMNSVANNSKKVSPYIEETRRMDVKVLRPDINVSTDKFYVVDGSIRCALQMINNIGEKTAKAILRIRGNKLFLNLKDVLRRIERSDVSRSNIETLVRAGALDALGEREQLLQQLKGDKEEIKLGFAEKVKEEIRLCDTEFLVDSTLKNKLITKSKETPNGVTGIITKIEKTKDKYEREMAKIQLLDFEGRNRYTVIFNRVWKEEKENIHEGAIVIGELDDRAFKKIKAFKL